MKIIKYKTSLELFLCDWT